MKEIPILFSAMMVQAILAGSKTMTRRLVKWPDVPKWHHPDYDACTVVKPKGGKWEPRFRHKGHNGKKQVDVEGPVKCLFGQPGDVLWVRENFRVNSWMPEDGEIKFRYEADGAISDWAGFDNEEVFNKYWQQSCDDLAAAGYKPNEQERYEDYDHKALRLRPNIFLRKEVARIWLQVTDVRVEQLKNITEEDAIAEGIEQMPSFNSGEGVYPGQKYMNYLPHGYTEVPALDSFESLWHKINGADSWSSNPWVWVISFNLLSKTGKPDLSTLNIVA